MKDMHKLKEMLCEELYEIGKKGKLSPGDIDIVYKLASSVKNINKNEMYEEDGHSERRGYSRDGEWMARGEYGNSYEDGSSERRRGMHYVRGHYSRDGGSYDGGSYDDGSSRRGYSRDGGKDEMLRMIDEMMGQAETEKQREALHRCRTELSRG